MRELARWSRTGVCTLILAACGYPRLPRIDGEKTDAFTEEIPNSDASSSDGMPVDAPGIDAPSIDALSIDAPIGAMRCGNGMPDPMEECDDGNASNADDCTMGCKAARCGDSFVRSSPANPLNREECDDPTLPVVCPYQHVE